jgi:hypothetical protein
MKSDIILGALSFEMNYWSNLEQFRNFYCIYCIEMLFIGGGGIWFIENYLWKINKCELLFPLNLFQSAR